MCATIHQKQSPSGRRAAPARRSGAAPRAAGVTGDDVCEIQFVDERRVRAAERAMKSSDVVAGLAETFKLLGDPTRVRVAWALAQEELCVCDLARLLSMSQSAVSHSLRALRQLRLVRFRKAGRIAYYRLDDDHIAHLLAEGFRHIEEHE
jgi:DNA-binding transcriptional ArsR family regulator